MQPQKHTITRMVMGRDRVYKPQKFEVTINLDRLDELVFVKAVRQVRVQGMGGAIQVKAVK